MMKHSLGLFLLLFLGLNVYGAPIPGSIEEIPAGSTLMFKQNFAIPANQIILNAPLPAWRRTGCALAPSAIAPVTRMISVGQTFTVIRAYAKTVNYLDSTGDHIQAGISLSRSGAEPSELDLSCYEERVSLQDFNDLLHSWLNAELTIAPPQVF